MGMLLPAGREPGQGGHLSSSSFALQRVPAPRRWKQAPSPCRKTPAIAWSLHARTARRCPGQHSGAPGPPARGWQHDGLRVAVHPGDGTCLRLELQPNLSRDVPTLLQPSPGRGTE